MYYNINLVTGEVCKSKSTDSLINDPYFSFGNDNSVIVSDAEKMLNNANITCAAMVRVYNQYSTENVKRFSDRKTAVRRTMTVMKKSKHIDEAPTNIASANILPDENVKGNYEQLVVSNNKNVPSKKIGRMKWADHMKDNIICLVHDNPKRKNSHGWRSFEIILNHDKNKDLSVEEYVKLGGRIADLKWDMNKCWLTLSSSEEK